MSTRASCALALSSLASLASSCAPVDQTDGNSEKYGDDSDAVRECAEGATVKGVDVSYYQGQVNWALAKKGGIGFAVARVSDGATFKDPRFAENWNGMKAAGIVRGTYLFFRPAEDPTAQANLLITMINQAGGLDPGDLPPALDVEVTDGVAIGTIIARMKTWLHNVEAATGRTPLIYTAPGFWAQFGNPAGFSKYTLWVANWGVACPGLPSSWSHWHFWQSTYNGAVPGISGAVDVDHFNGSLADLKAFAGGHMVIAGSADF